jgi:hypothetical protein
MTRTLAGRLIGALLMAVFVTAAAAPAYGQASSAPPTASQPVDATPPGSGSTPENSNTVPENSKGQEKPRMQWEEQTLFAFRHLRAIGA